jgi:hypothetical protein
VLTGEWDPPPLELDTPVALKLVEPLPGVFIADQVLSLQDCRKLAQAMEDSKQAWPVSVQGRRDLPDARIGSVRATAWSPELAARLWGHVQPMVPSYREMSDTTPTDWFVPLPHWRWRALGLSPVLRFMRYQAGGLHYAHYDAGFDYQDGRRTLMSLVLYLSTAAEGVGGRTRSIQDNQQSIPVWQRDHEDWPRPVLPEEVLLSIRPVAGRALLFDHRLCHDVEEYRGEGARIIIRGDVVFEALD